MINDATYDKAIKHAYDTSVLVWDSKEQARKFHSVELNKWRKIFDLAHDKGVKILNTKVGRIDVNNENHFIGLAGTICEYSTLKYQLAG